jgi:Dna[CI] antecedent, DciA
MRKLAAALAGWTPENRPHDPLALLEAGWPEIVGAEVARNSHPSRIVEGTLLVITRSSAWSNQLSFLGDHVRRAVAARLPKAGVDRLRFRVGRVPELSGPPATRARARSRRPAAERPATLSPAAALTRFRQDVEARQQSRREAGWNECAACGALEVATPGEWCAACDAKRAGARAEATARLLFEAPWLGYGGTASLVKGLQPEEYERIRTGLLKHWWGKLAHARAAKQLSRDRSERVVASAYVLLQSKLPPEEIMPATVRGILGDELHEMLYGKPAPEGGAVKSQKRRE